MGLSVITGDSANSSSRSMSDWVDSGSKVVSISIVSVALSSVCSAKLRAVVDVVVLLLLVV